MSPQEKPPETMPFETLERVTQPTTVYQEHVFWSEGSTAGISGEALYQRIQVSLLITTDFRLEEKLALKKRRTGDGISELMRSSLWEQNIWKWEGGQVCSRSSVTRKTLWYEDSPSMIEFEWGSYRWWSWGSC